MLAVLCALGSSLMYSLASVLQQRGAAAEAPEHSLTLGLLVRLARNRGWMVGLVCDGAAYVLQFIALGHGPIVVVQPLLVCGLLFALPIGAAWAGRHLHPGDWLGAVLVCIGLAMFLTVARPAAGRDNAPPSVWIALLVADVGVTAALVAASFGRDVRLRAVLLSGAAGVIYGAAAALTKTTSHLLGKGVVHTAVHWQPYMLIVVAVVGMVLGQSAFQAGTLDVSLPTMTVVDPVVSIAIGALAFHERIAADPVAVIAEVLGLAIMSVGVFMLARVEATTGVG